MSLRCSLTIECDRPTCQAEIVIRDLDIDVEPRSRGGLDIAAFAPDWWQDENEQFICPQCAAEDERDPAYERAAARARHNDFADTKNRDWT